MTVNPLTNASLADAPAAPSVEDNAAAAEVEVAEVSGSETTTPANVVDAARFNGLMGAYNKLKSQKEQELATTQARIAELEAALANRSQEAPEVDEATSRKIDALFNAFQKQQLQATRQSVLAEFPEAAPFADLIVADDPDEYREMAKTIAERAKAFAPAQPPVTEPSAPTEPPAPENAPQAPVIGGANGFHDSVSRDERIQEALEARNFTAWLAAKTADI